MGKMSLTWMVLRELLRDLPSGQSTRVLQTERDHSLLYVPLGQARQ